MPGQVKQRDVAVLGASRRSSALAVFDLVVERVDQASEAATVDCQGSGSRAAQAAAGRRRRRDR